MKQDTSISQRIVQALFEYREGALIYRDGCGLASGKVAELPENHMYRRVRLFGRYEYIHRLVFLYHHGHLPEIVDHIDGDTKNNLIENLRAVSPAESAWNTGSHKRNSTGAKGVHYDPITGRYRAEIMHTGKKIRLGRFESVAAASAAYEKKARELRGDFVRN